GQLPGLSGTFIFAEAKRWRRAPQTIPGETGESAKVDQWNPSFANFATVCEDTSHRLVMGC
ncbi:MAG: hypothetical protein WCB53_21550, partial [Terriglobales bacterium]